MGFWIGLAASGIFGSFQLPSLRDAGLMTLAGFVSFLGQILMIMGLKVRTYYKANIFFVWFPANGSQIVVSA